MLSVDLRKGGVVLPHLALDELRADRPQPVRREVRLDVRRVVVVRHIAEPDLRRQHGGVKRRDDSPDSRAARRSWAKVGMCG